MSRKKMNIKNPVWLCGADTSIGTDDSFERPYGCWNKKQRESFIISVMSDNVSTPFVVADVSKCEDHCEKLDCASGKRWFSEEKAKGHDFISIDGKHRRQTICDYANDKFAVSGEFQNQQGKKHKIVKKKYSELDEEVKLQFDNCELLFTMLSGHTRADLALEFIRINSAAALTRQHLRMATDSVMSRWIRDEAVFYDALLSRYQAKSTAECKPHENMSKIFLHCESESGSVSIGALDNLYYRGLKEGQSGCMSNAYAIGTIGMAQEIYKILDSLEVMQSETMLFTLVVKRVVENLYEIVDTDCFKQSIKTLDSRLNDTSYGEFDRTRKRQKKKEDYYFHWKTQNWNQSRVKRAGALWDEIMKHPAAYSLELASEEVRPAPLAAVTVTAAPTPAP